MENNQSGNKEQNSSGVGAELRPTPDSCVGERYKDVEQLRSDCHATYNGGHHEQPAHDAFHHGMDTVCNVLNGGWLKARIEAAESRNRGRKVMRDGLVELMERIEAKRPSIRSWDNYGKDTFLAFDSYNLGLTEAKDMLGAFIIAMEINEPA